MIPIVLTEEVFRSLYEDTYYENKHEKDFETWLNEKIAKGIFKIKTESKTNYATERR